MNRRGSCGSRTFRQRRSTAAAPMPPPYDVVLASRPNMRRHSTLRPTAVVRIQDEIFFGYHRDLPPKAIAQILGGRIVMSNSARQWIAVIALERAVDAKAAIFHPPSSDRAGRTILPLNRISTMTFDGCPVVVHRDR